jgi:hypothetical protein
MSSFLNLYRLINTFLGRNIFALALLVVVILSFSREDEPKVFHDDFGVGGSEESISFDGSKSISPRSVSKKIPHFSSSNFISTALATADNIKIIKKASLELEVLDTEKVKNEIDGILKEYDAYLSNLNSYEVRKGTLSYHFILKVPSHHLENFLEKLNTLGDKKSYNYDLADITQQYSDTSAKIKNLETRRDRLRKLLEFKTKNLNDVLNVDRELSRVQLEIDNLTRVQLGRDNDIKFSTVDLALNPEPQLGDSIQENWSLERSWKVSINGFLDTIKQIIDVVILAIAYSPIIALVVFIAFWVKRKFPRKISGK